VLDSTGTPMRAVLQPQHFQPIIDQGKTFARLNMQE
jgi:hypothetical protein